jgi:putative ABC transport system permease protein
MIFMAIDGIKERKFRVALNIVGILIGIAALTALVSITQGMNVEVNRQMERLGPTTITVIPGGSLGIMQRPGVSGTLTLKDVGRIERMPKVALTTPLVSGTAEIRIGDYSDFVTVLGVIPEEYVQIVKNIKVENGRFLRQSDGVLVVLGANVAHPPHLEEPIAQIGDRIVIIANVEGEEKTLTLRVAGILAKVGGLISPDNQIFVTIRTAQQIFNSGNTVSQILIEAKNIEVVEDVVKEVQDELGKKATVISASFIRETIGSVINILGAVLGGVAAISLIVAGIAIINTMTISVMERTREIGIMKALGAKNKHVLSMFLIESSLTGLIGGVVGVIFGIFLGQIVAAIATFTIGISLISVPSLEIGITGILFAVVTGILAGFYPAQKASKLDPVEALRYE